MVSQPALTNQDIATVLREIGERLQTTGDSPFRVAAYRRAATTISMYPRDVVEILSQEGEAGLRRLPGIGKSLARTLARLVRQGRSVKLERLRKQSHGKPLLCTVPGVGTKLAERMQQTLGANSLEEVFAAACDGRLRRVPGLGTKCVRSIRESLASRLQAGATLLPPCHVHEPPVAELLSIDQEYLAREAAGRLPLSAPRLFNPTGGLWLPILRTQRGNRLYNAHFANTVAAINWVLPRLGCHYLRNEAGLRTMDGDYRDTRQIPGKAVGDAPRARMPRAL